MNIATPPPSSDPVTEARRILELARLQGVTVRLLGGLAVVFSAGGPLPPGLQRVYKDLDFVTIKKDAAKFNALLVEAGYEADAQFNTLHGAQRLLHYDRVNGKQLDTFVDTFAMCHTLDLSKRLPIDSDTLTPADLLLTKLQIVEVNDKDLIDSIALLLFHPISESDRRTIRLDELRPILRSDWGWYTTITDNLAEVADRVARVDLTQNQKNLVLERIAELDAAIESFPKGVKWTLRSKVGRKMPWYDLPEEV
jgi:hypothetical protein